ncbi:MAG TPA: hypothetical protein VMO88_03120 [Acidimicrobiales bacterium]|nr:hypothetical protein [Acidimicrobiales bacterium]
MITDPRADESTTGPAAEPIGPGRRRRRRITKLVALAIVLGLLAPVGYSYASALTGPGTDALSVRSVEWLRTHHFRWLVNDVENYWYSHHKPKKGGLPGRKLRQQVNGSSSDTTPPASGVTVPPAVTVPPVVGLPPPAPLQPFVSNPLPGEGSWQPLGQPVDGQPAMYATYMRPDSVYTSLVSGVAWIDPKLVTAVSYAGAVEPGGSGWAHQLPISDAVRPNLLAAFNSGFRMQDARGGYYDSGRYARPLRAGAATLWITADGTSHVGMWGRDVSLTPDVMVARQNLDLIVDGGRPVPGLDVGSSAQWGFTVANKVMVWRSGVGETANGALVYAAGPDLSVHMLADLLARAGAVRAMELDINSAWVDFFSYTPAPAGLPPADLTVKKLLVDMVPSTSHYLTASSRDCIALFARP